MLVNNIKPYIILFIELIVFTGCLSSPDFSSPKFLNTNIHRKIDSKIIAGYESIEKQNFYYNEWMTDITYIVSGELDSEDGPDVGVFDQFGMDIVDFDGKRKSSIFFNWEGAVLEPDIRMKKNGDFEFIVRYQAPFGLMDQRGEPIWVFNDELSYKMAFGDTNKDDFPEYYIATTSLIQLDMQGKKIWQTRDEIFNDVEVYNPDNSERSLVVTSNHAGIIQLRDYKGNIVDQWTPKEKIHNFKICRWLNSQYILTSHNDEIIIIDLNGQEIMHHKVSHSPSGIYSIRGVSVKFDRDKDYFAVVTKFSSATGLSMLCIFSPEKKLIFQELVGATTGLAAIDMPFSKRQMLLVGNGPGLVNKYEWR
jgi:hypothetical protein